MPDISTIESLIAQAPLGLLSAHQWYSDHPTDSDATFSGTGFFSGGDLPFGLVVELHSAPAGARFRWRDSIQFTQPWGHLVNNAALAGGFSSTLPVEEFLITRPRELFRFHEPTTESIILEVLGGAFVELWGLYLNVPLLTPSQMGWTSTGTASTSFEPTFDGTVYTGLTNTGVIPLDDFVVGVRVEITTQPDALGVDFGEPDYVWQLGWINWGSPHGFNTRELVTAAQWESIRPALVDRDIIGYSFHPGVVATVTNLLPNS